MIDYCDFCYIEHDDYQWKVRIQDEKLITLCRQAFSSLPVSPAGSSMDLSKRGKRLTHFKEITTRVRTHEGELLSGVKGQKYQQRYGEKYLGISPRPVNFDSTPFQKELAKTR